jgi:hypothetical protein
MLLPPQIEYRVPELFEEMPSPRRRLFGLHREILAELRDARLIRVIEVTRPSCRRSVELVYIPSLIDCLERFEELAENKRKAEIRAGYAHFHKPEDLLEVVKE